MARNYWNGKVALICSYCQSYRSFGSVEELKEHIKKEHGDYKSKGRFNESCQEVASTPSKRNPS